MFNANLQSSRVKQWEELFNKYSTVDSTSDVYDATLDSWIAEPVEEGEKLLLDEDIILEINQRWEEGKTKTLREDINCFKIVEASAISAQDEISEDNNAGGCEKPDQQKYLSHSISIPHFYEAFLCAVSASRTGKRCLNGKIISLRRRKILHGRKRQFKTSQNSSKDSDVPSSDVDEPTPTHQICPEASGTYRTCSGPAISSSSEENLREKLDSLPLRKSKLKKAVCFEEHKSSDKDISPQRPNSSDRSGDIHLEKLYLQYASPKIPRRYEKKITLSSESPRTFRLRTENPGPLFSPSKALRRHTEGRMEQTGSFDSSPVEHPRKRLELQPTSPKSPKRFSKKLQLSLELSRASRTQKENFRCVPTSREASKHRNAKRTDLPKSPFTSPDSKHHREKLVPQCDSPNIQGQLNEIHQLLTDSSRSPTNNIQREDFTTEDISYSVSASRTCKQRLNGKIITLPRRKILHTRKSQFKTSQNSSQDSDVPSSDVDEPTPTRQICPENSDTCCISSGPEIISSSEENSREKCDSLPLRKSKLEKNVRFELHKSSDSSDEEISPRRPNSFDKSGDIHFDKPSGPRLSRLDQRRQFKSSQKSSNKRESPRASSNTSKLQLPPEKLSLSPEPSRSGGLQNRKLKSPLHSPRSSRRLSEIPRLQPDSPGTPRRQTERRHPSPETLLRTSGLNRHLEILYLQRASAKIPRRYEKKITLSSESPRTLKFYGPLFPLSETLRRHTEGRMEQTESFASSRVEHCQKRLELQPTSPESPRRFSEKLRLSADLLRASRSQKENFGGVSPSPERSKNHNEKRTDLAESSFTSPDSKHHREKLVPQSDSQKNRGQLNEMHQLLTESSRTPTYNIQRKALGTEDFSCSGNTPNGCAIRGNQFSKSTGKRITLDSAVLRKEAEERRARFSTKKRSLFAI